MKTLNQLTTEYLDFCKYNKNLDFKTRKAYNIDLRQYANFTCNSFLSPFDKTVVTEYITYLYTTYQPRTIRRKIASLKAFFHYLEYEEILSNNPFDKLHVKLREPINLPKTIPLQYISHFLSILYQQKKAAITPQQYKAALRNIAITELLFATGARISELCTLRPEQINLNEHFICLYGKGRKERLIQIENPDVITALAEYELTYAAEIQKSGWYFINRLGNRYSEQSMRQMIQKHADLAHIDQHITPHMFRHTFATLLLEADVDIRYIQNMLGHSSITTTQIYTRVSMAKQRDILANKHPRNTLAITKD